METLMEEKVGSAAETDPTILTQESYERLHTMLESRDPADHKMAQLILNKLNWKESIYYIWLLTYQNVHNMLNLRTKDSRKFRDDLDIYRLCRSNAHEFGSYLISKDWMTPELFMKLKKKILKIANKTSHNYFYDFHVTIKEEYVKLDHTDELTKLKDLL